MKKWLKYIAIALLVFGLILVRRFEDDLFYDPFLAYFKGQYLTGFYPDYSLTKLILSLILRYGLNTLLSIGIIYLIFNNIKYVKFSLMVFGVSLLLLLPIYLYFIETQFELGENIGFYVRRILIQPLLLLVLIAAFFYLSIKPTTTTP